MAGQSELLSGLNAALVRCLGADEGARVAALVERDLRKHYGGSYHYVPQPSLEERNRKLLEDFRGCGDRDAVCRRFGVSRQTFYRALSEARKFAD